VLSVYKRRVPAKSNILMQASKILPTTSPIYVVNPSIVQRYVADILSVCVCVGGGGDFQDV
jgi:hypothetical protein